MMTDIGIWVIAVCSVLAFAAGVVNHIGIRDLHLIMNSRLDELVKTATEKAFLMGNEQGRADAKREETSRLP